MLTMLPVQSVGMSLEHLRELAGLSLAEVARLAESSENYLWLVEAGYMTPTKGYVARIAAVIAGQLGAVD